MNCTVCPAKVAKPSDEPTGALIPVGNGLLRVAAGARKLLGWTIWVVWLKPYCCWIGLVEYLPAMSSCVMPIGCTYIAKPPRMEVLPCRRSGVHANPARGLNRCEVCS